MEHPYTLFSLRPLAEGGDLQAKQASWMNEQQAIKSDGGSGSNQ